MIAYRKHEISHFEHTTLLAEANISITLACSWKDQVEPESLVATR